jgi:hypothetical protein
MMWSPAAKLCCPYTLALLHVRQPNIILLMMLQQSQHTLKRMVHVRQPNISLSMVWATDSQHLGSASVSLRCWMPCVCWLHASQQMHLSQTFMSIGTCMAALL